MVGAPVNEADKLRGKSVLASVEAAGKKRSRNSRHGNLSRHSRLAENPAAKPAGFSYQRPLIQRRLTQQLQAACGRWRFAPAWRCQLLQHLPIATGWKFLRQSLGVTDAVARSGQVFSQLVVFNSHLKRFWQAPSSLEKRVLISGDGIKRLPEFAGAQAVLMFIGSQSVIASWSHSIGRNRWPVPATIPHIRSCLRSRSGREPHQVSTVAVSVETHHTIAATDRLPRLVMAGTPGFAHRRCWLSRTRWR